MALLELIGNKTDNMLKKRILIVIFIIFFIGCTIQHHQDSPLNYTNKNLELPSEEYSTYTVKKNDTLWKIAKLYHVDLISLCRINKFSPSHKLRVGERIFIPQSNNLYYQWPLKGEVSFSNKGIDIKTNKSIIVYPFAEGKIDFAQNINGYGYTIIIKHRANLSSVYSNLAKIYVREGMWVKKRQPLGKIGKNVRNGEAYLYFELRKNGKSINPFLYLR